MHKSSSADERVRACDVLIVGGGPVGLLMAIALGRRGIDVCLLEKSDGLCELPRAISFDAETLRSFAALGILDDVETWLTRGLPTKFVNGRGQTFVDVPAIESPYGHPAVNSFWQPGIERALLKAAGEVADLRFGAEVQQLEHGSDHVIAKAKGRIFVGRYAVGCDGGSSFVRRTLDIPFTGSTFKQRWLVVDAKREHPDFVGTTFTCDPRRPAVSVPADAKHWRWEFLLRPGEDENAILSDDSIGELLPADVDPSQIEVVRKTIYTFHGRVAERWRAGNVLLAGDAAHVMPPFAGQGLNSGFRDVMNLSWKLAAVLDGRADDSLLDTYDEERRSHVEKMVKAAIVIGEIVMPQSRVRAAIRDALFVCINAFGPSRRFFSEGRLLPRSEIAGKVLIGKGLGAGRMLPQPMVDGGPLDQKLGDQFALVACGKRDPLEHLGPEDRKRIQRSGMRLVRAGDSLDAFSSETGGENAWLVRPDRYVMQGWREPRDMLGWLNSIDLASGQAATATVEARIAANG